MAAYSIDLPACRGRQRRLLAVMERLDLDLVIVARIEHVQWLAGPRFNWHFSPCAALARDGRLTLASPDKQPAEAAADEVVIYSASHMGTVRNDQPASSLAALSAAVASDQARRIGCDSSAGAAHLMQFSSAEWIDLEPELYRLRRRKDADELTLIRKAIAGTGAMHAAARKLLAPGVKELDVFSALYAAAVREFGEPPTAVGNDFACGERGGPARDRAIETAELYILDLGPAFRGYFADNTRTYAVGGNPSDQQQRAWEKVVAVFPLVERTIKPGVSCRGVFDACDSLLAESRPWVFGHHLGHGVGLFPHEAPHLNPHWDDAFEAGDVIAVEPGLYGPDLRAGIRLENNYLVTDTGVELLSDFPLEL